MDKDIEDTFEEFLAQTAEEVEEFKPWKINWSDEDSLENPFQEPKPKKISTSVMKVFNSGQYSNKPQKPCAAEDPKENTQANGQISKSKVEGQKMYQNLATAFASHTKLPERKNQNLNVEKCSEIGNCGNLKNTLSESTEGNVPPATPEVMFSQETPAEDSGKILSSEIQPEEISDLQTNTNLDTLQTPEKMTPKSQERNTVKIDDSKKNTQTSGSSTQKPKASKKKTPKAKKRPLEKTPEELEEEPRRSKRAKRSSAGSVAKKRTPKKVSRSQQGKRKSSNGGKGSAKKPKKK